MDMGAVILPLLVSFCGEPTGWHLRAAVTLGTLQAGGAAGHADLPCSSAFPRQCDNVIVTWPLRVFMFYCNVIHFIS